MGKIHSSKDTQNNRTVAEIALYMYNFESQDSFLHFETQQIYVHIHVVLELHTLHVSFF